MLSKFLTDMAIRAATQSITNAKESAMSELLFAFMAPVAIGLTLVLGYVLGKVHKK